MTAYNSMPYLEAAVDSILNQTYQDFEFIIVNDGSTDENMKAYLDGIQDKRVRVFHEPNRGTAGGSNFGLKQCTRKYIARMDADDISLPNRLEVQVDFMENNPDVALVGSQIQVIGAKSTGLEISIPCEHDEIYQALLDLNHGMNHGSCFYRNELIQKIDGYWKVHKFYDDWDMFLRMGEQGKLANLPIVLYQYRTLSTSLVGSRLAEMRNYFAFAVECAKRRKSGDPSLTKAEFDQELKKRPFWTRQIEAIGNYALNQYRIANAEICNGKKLLGYSRLGFAAICSPARTMNRVSRILSVRKHRRAT